MLFTHFTQAGALSSPAIMTRRGTTTWRQMSVRTKSLCGRFQRLRGSRVGVQLPPTGEGLAALAALDGVAASSFLFDAQMEFEQILELARDLDLNYVVHQVSDLDSEWQVRPLDGADRLGGNLGNEPSITILTSGTEGRPKAARHTWQSLRRPVRETIQPQRWLLTYRIHLYAGLQVMLQALLNHGTLVAPEPDASPDDVVELMTRSQVEYASATPSYWRRLVLFADRERLSQVPLRQMTLGGEAVDQQILDSLAAVFPAARIAHIYATTELGRCFSVTDGRCGFPFALLEHVTSEGVELRVKDGQLFVRSENAMSRYDQPGFDSVAFDSDDWFPTGDLVEIHGDRVLFVGRKGEIINVGGNKVHPLAIEERLRAIPGVADVRVYAKSSSIAGQLVACELVLAAGAKESTVRTSISEATEEMQSYQRPRFIDFVSEITLSLAGKSKRA